MNRRQLICTALSFAVAPGLVIAAGGYGTALLPKHKEEMAKLAEELLKAPSDATYNAVTWQIEDLAMEIANNVDDVTNPGVLIGSYARLLESEVILMSFIRSSETSNEVKEQARRVLGLVRIALEKVRNAWHELGRPTKELTSRAKKLQASFEPSPIIDRSRK